MAKQQAATAPAQSGGGGAPILRLVLGAILILMFLLATMLQIQTSEAFILNGQAVGLSANWAILKQPFELAQGTLSLSMAKAVMWGWGIECIYLVCVVGEWCDAAGLPKARESERRRRGRRDRNGASRADRGIAHCCAPPPVMVEPL
jgi:hypothetical protein